VITFASCFPLGKVHRWWTYVNCGVQLVYHLVLGTLILGVPSSWGSTLDIDTDERFLWNRPVIFLTFVYIFDTIIFKCVHMPNVFCMLLFLTKDISVS